MAVCSEDYAKLMRKRDKTLGPDGHPIRIDLETLRASTRAANEKENAQQQQQHTSTAQKASSGEHQQASNTSPGQIHSVDSSPVASASKAHQQSSHQAPSQPQYPSTHTPGPYSYSGMTGVTDGTSNLPPPPLSSGSVLSSNSLGQGQGVPSSASPQPWGNPPSSAGRSYAHEQSQSFLRTSHSSR